MGLGAVTSLLAAAALVTGCWRGADGTGHVRIANLSSSEASVHWQSPGLLGGPILGGSGTEPIPPCDVYDRAFGPGTHVLDTVAKERRYGTALVAPPSGQVVLWLLISPAGDISQATDVEIPASPYC